MLTSKRIVVVLPAPLLPISANAAPLGTRNATSRTAVCRPKRFVRPFDSIVIADGLQALGAFPAGFDGRDDFVQARAHASRLDDELIDLVLQQPLAVAGPRLGPGCDQRADAGPHLEPALLDQVLDTLCAVLGWIFRSAASVRTDGNGWPGRSSPLTNARVAANTTWSKID